MSLLYILRGTFEKNSNCELYFQKRACDVYQFARATITKYDKLSALNNRNVRSDSCRGETSESKVSAGPCSLQRR